jgi:hypothetical protein
MRSPRKIKEIFHHKHKAKHSDANPFTEAITETFTEFQPRSSGPEFQGSNEERGDFLLVPIVPHNVQSAHIRDANRRPIDADGRGKKSDYQA